MTLGEDGRTMAISNQNSGVRVRRLGIALLLLAVPACGLSDYEALMRESQEREERFREEQKYLGEPLIMPAEKDKDGHETPIAEVFLRPPKGIQKKPEPQQRNNLMWDYKAASTGSEFALVELAFADDDKDFATKVFAGYQATEQVRSVEHDPPLPFDSWEFNEGKYGYSVHITKTAQPRIAIVYVFDKARRDSVRKAIDRSLESLAVNQQTIAAQQRYRQKNPWRLQNKTVP
jgi:hypothetical protein